MKNNNTSIKRAGLAAAIAALMTGCGSSDGGSSQGTLSVSLTDSADTAIMSSLLFIANADETGGDDTEIQVAAQGLASNVYVTVKGVSLMMVGGDDENTVDNDTVDNDTVDNDTVDNDSTGAMADNDSGADNAGGGNDDSGWVAYELATPQIVDLLTLEDNDISLLDGIELEAGEYKIRLELHNDLEDDVDDQYIVLTDGTQHDMTVPSGSQTGLKLIDSIVVSPDASANFAIDFDVDASVVQTGAGSYLLRPTLNLVDNTDEVNDTGDNDTVDNDTVDNDTVDNDTVDNDTSA